MDGKPNWIVRDDVVRCNCGTIPHVMRKRFCCGIDWLAKYNTVMYVSIVVPVRKDEPLPIGVSRPVRTIPSNPSVRHEAIQKYREDNNVEVVSKKKKKRKSHSSVSPETRIAVLERDSHRCVKCQSTQKLQVHHIWHRKFGGSNDMANLETLCLKCHIKEHKNEPIAKVMAKSL